MSRFAGMYAVVEGHLLSMFSTAALSDPAVWIGGTTVGQSNRALWAAGLWPLVVRRRHWITWIVLSSPGVRRFPNQLTTEGALESNRGCGLITL